MEDMTSIVDAVLFKEIYIAGGRKLVVLARRIEKEQWELSVRNEYGISTNWSEYFPSAEIAIDIGTKTIEKEGNESFIDTEGYEYLFE